MLMKIVEIVFLKELPRFGGGGRRGGGGGKGGRRRKVYSKKQRCIQSDEVDAWRQASRRGECNQNKVKLECEEDEEEGYSQQKEE